MSLLDDYRLAPILDDPSLFDNASTDLFSLDLPPLQDSSAYRPTYDSSVHNNATPARTRPNEQHGDHLRSSNTAQRGRSSTKTTVPIAEVLNHDTPRDTTSPTRRRRQDNEERLRSDWIHLPEPPTVAAQGSNQQPALPPLLQGLLEPPPDAGLFPRIQHSGEDIGSWQGNEGQKNISRVENHLVERRPPNWERVHGSGAAVPRVLNRPERRGSPEVSKRHDHESSLQLPTEHYVPSKRRKWTDAELKALKSGVAKYGKGHWRMILSDPAFQFNDRSIVDLKDRWRVNERSQARDRAAKGQTLGEKPMQVANMLRDNTPLNDNAKDSTSKAARGRVEFTAAQDAAILRGFDKWGPKWTYIQAGESVLEQRKPRDIRDRFRFRWPDKYTAAGLSLGKAGPPGRVKEGSITNARQVDGRGQSGCVAPADVWSAPG